MRKEDARKYGLAARNALTSQERLIKDKYIFDQTMDRCRNVQVIGCYVSYRNEADTRKLIHALLNEGKTVAVPKVTGHTLVFHRIASLDSLAESTMHILEPVTEDAIEIEEIDLMFVPLSSYDNDMNRTGYGGGYYDRILHRCRRKVGLAYACQKVDAIEADPWDIKLDEVISA